MKKHKRTKKIQHKVSTKINKGWGGMGVAKKQGEHEETQDKSHENFKIKKKINRGGGVKMLQKHKSTNVLKNKVIASTLNIGTSQF